LRNASNTLWKKGYSSVEEFVTHVLEKELRNQSKISQDEEKEIEKKLKGLGYLR